MKGGPERTTGRCPQDIQFLNMNRAFAVISVTTYRCSLATGASWPLRHPWCTRQGRCCLGPKWHVIVEDKHPASLLLRWDNPEVFLIIFWGPHGHKHILHVDTLCTDFIPFPVSLPLSPTDASRDQLRNPWLALKSLSQGLVLGKPNLRHCPILVLMTTHFFVRIFPYPGTTSLLVPWKIWHGSQIHK